MQIGVHRRKPLISAFIDFKSVMVSYHMVVNPNWKEKITRLDFAFLTWWMKPKICPNSGVENSLLRSPEVHCSLF